MKHRYILMSAHKEMRGFEYLVYSAFSFCLISILLLLPLAPVFADEITINEPIPESTPSDTLTTQAVVPDTTEPVVELHNTDTTGEQDTAPIQINATPGSEIVDSATNSPISVANDGAGGSATGTDASTTHTAIENVEQSTTTDEISVSDTVERITPQEPDTVASPEKKESVAAVASTTEHVVNVVTNDENKFSFSKNECTTVGDGTFYCATASDAPQVLHTDRIFSALDAESDKEIYIEKSGELTALTNNQVDDDAPYFDEVSNTAVWHQLIDGRYQIIQYDFNEGSEKQLTYDSFNNMQPSVFGDTVVWQGWVGDDWEIFMSVHGQTTMLTDNTIHDIAPSVNGTHIAWQSFEGNLWRMKVYDINTGLIDSIEDSEGGSIENPRFVLVYDAKMETGDIETRGYDLKSGKVLDLASKPASVPEEIPDPEQTGEKRALVAPGTQPKTKADSDENDDVGTTTASGVDDGDLIIPSPDESDTNVHFDTASSTVVEVSDVIVPAFGAGSTTPETDHIENLVIEPYVATSSIPSESQDAIVSDE